MLSPRLIATEGLGGTVRLVAVRGLWPATEVPESPPSETGGGASPFTRPLRIGREEDETLILVLLG